MSYLTYVILKLFAVSVVGTALLVGGLSLMACIANFFGSLYGEHTKGCKILGMILLTCLVLAAFTFLVCDCTGLIPHLPITSNLVVEES